MGIANEPALTVFISMTSTSYGSPDSSTMLFLITSVLPIPGNENKTGTILSLLCSSAKRAFSVIIVAASLRLIVYATESVIMYKNLSY